MKTAANAHKLLH